MCEGAANKHVSISVSDRSGQQVMRLGLRGKLVEV